MNVISPDGAKVLYSITYADARDKLNVTICRGDGGGPEVSRITTHRFSSDVVYIDFHGKHFVHGRSTFPSATGLGELKWLCDPPKLCLQDEHDTLAILASKEDNFLATIHGHRGKDRILEIKRRLNAAQIEEIVILAIAEIEQRRIHFAKILEEEGSNKCTLM
jgi:hypothetical protein